MRSHDFWEWSLASYQVYLGGRLDLEPYTDIGIFEELGYQFVDCMCVRTYKSDKRVYFLKANFRLVVRDDPLAQSVYENTYLSGRRLLFLFTSISTLLAYIYEVQCL